MEGYKWWGGITGCYALTKRGMAKWWWSRFRSKHDVMSVFDWKQRKKD
jgi:hypothetical protein